MNNTDLFKFARDTPYLIHILSCGVSIMSMLEIHVIVSYVIMK